MNLQINELLRASFEKIRIPSENIVAKNNAIKVKIIAYKIPFAPPKTAPKTLLAPPSIAPLNIELRNRAKNLTAIKRTKNKGMVYATFNDVFRLFGN